MSADVTKIGSNVVMKPVTAVRKMGANITLAPAIGVRKMGVNVVLKEGDGPAVSISSKYRPVVITT